MANELYPIFLKTHRFPILIIGGGNVAHEKLSFLLKSSPNSNVKLIAKEFSSEVLGLAQAYGIKTISKAYDKTDLINKQLVIAATNDIEINQNIYRDSKSLNILVNVADTPHLCDFYLGGIVTKGDVKIAISTNGKSPSMAKRLRQFFEQNLPHDINQLVNNLNKVRHSISDDLEKRSKTINSLTQQFLNEKCKSNHPEVNL